MNRNQVKHVGVILLAGIAMSVVLSACGGSAGTTRPSAATPTPTSVLTATPTPAPAPTQGAVPLSTPVPTPTVNNGSGDLLAQGKLIFEKTAGGVGCASCHGLDGKGGVAPYIRGAPKFRVREALAGVSAMSFIKLNDEEIAAVVAYLKWLNTQP